MKQVESNAEYVKSLNVTLKYYPEVLPIVHTIAKKGGRSLLVGGAVRDLFLKRELKDLDIEVHGLTMKSLEHILRQYGPVSTVGKAFGVVRLHNLDVDWSLPRTDSSGRKPQVTLDKDMDLRTAFARRDLTINAMGIDLITKELVDPFHGLDDIKKGILRSPDVSFFVEDPLRLFRVMQFVGRFEMAVDDELNAVCKTMDVSSVSVERIDAEFQKLLLRSKKPSLGIIWLHSIGRLNDLFPELEALVGVQQAKKWHPEGDVFEHTMQSLDAAAVLEYKDAREKLYVMFAVLCHDLGKPETTEFVDERWRSFGHEVAGVPVTKRFLKRITKNKELIDAVVKLVQYHMAPVQFVTEQAKVAAYKRLAKKLSSDVTLNMLAKVAYADKQGRNEKKGCPLQESIQDIDTFLMIAHNAHVQDEPEKPLLYGRDFIDMVQPGPELGRIVEKAYQLQLDENIKDKETLKQIVLRELEKEVKK